MNESQPQLPKNIAGQVREALAEDIGNGDLTAALVPAEATAVATIVVREDAVVCGQAWVNEVFRQVDAAVTLEWQVQEGRKVAAETLLCRLRGPARALLTGERTALNFLQTLSATATVANEYAALVDGTDCRILDTRKTIPGLRLAQKYAVAVGGCQNHRIGLFDAILIKENHIAAAGSIAAAVQKGRETAAAVTLEVEVESLAELDEALAAGADIIMLDNFTLDMTREAVSKARGRAKLEASGNLESAGIRAVAETGVDFISVGALTKHVRAIDLSMRFDFEGT
ncbi:MAG: carboxylating nicotinate-nucleotide diphosphorylase [Gammaproteobacteria bacterium]|nr:carboxylating nicotinate-nucleotide diphosphorylase [Gammaproteobacteria bacterium]